MPETGRKREEHEARWGKREDAAVVDGDENCGEGAWAQRTWEWMEGGDLAAVDWTIWKWAVREDEWPVVPTL